jgi:hypothetical protein
MPIEFVHSVMALIMNRPVELEAMFDQAECPAEAPPSATTTIEPFISLSHCCVQQKTESPRGNAIGKSSLTISAKPDVSWGLCVSD